MSGERNKFITSQQGLSLPYNLATAEGIKEAIIQKIIEGPAADSNYNLLFGLLINPNYKDHVDFIKKLIEDITHGLQNSAIQAYLTWIENNFDNLSSFQTNESSQFVKDTVDLYIRSNKALMNVKVPKEKYCYLNNLSYENAEFVGRKELLEQLKKGWKSPESQSKNAGKHSIQSLVGLGGVGKTQIALAYAHAQQNLSDEQKRPFFIRWMKAEGIQIMSSFRALAEDINPNLAEKTTDQEILIYVYKKLKKIPRWLLIFDNVDKYEAIKPYLPPPDCCQIGQHVLITSISETWPNQLIKKIKVSEFTEDETLNYFEKNFSRLNGQLRVEASCLAKELGYLPLAVSHAVAFMQMHNLNITMYRGEYHRKGLEVLKVHPIDETLPYPHTVLTTWLMAIEQLQKSCQEAIVLLNHCAYLASNIKRDKLNIWLGLFKTEDILEGAIKALSDYSLVDIINISSESILVFHRLVQAVARDRQKNEIGKNTYDTTTKAVWNKIKGFIWKDPKTWFCMEEFLEHCEILLKEACSFATSNEEIMLLANRVQDYFWVQGNYVQAEVYARKSLSLAKRFYGDNVIHPYIATLLHNLGSELRDQGKISEAQEYFEKALDMKRKLYTKNEAQNDIGITLNALGMMLYRQNHNKEAQQYYEEALNMTGNDQKIDILTKNSNIATIKHNLGLALLKQDLVSKAEKNFKESLQTEYEIHGKNAINPDIALTLGSLGTSCKMQHQYLKASKYYRQALEMFYQCYGRESNHPYIANMLQNIESLELEQSQQNRAISHIEESKTHQHKKNEENSKIPDQEHRTPPSFRRH